MVDIIKTLENEEIAKLGKSIPKFDVGDTVAVGVKVVEGNRKRIQVFEGIVIAKDRYPYYIKVTGRGKDGN